jgi:hypothetical protein
LTFWIKKSLSGRTRRGECGMDLPLIFQNDTSAGIGTLPPVGRLVVEVSTGLSLHLSG